MHSFSRFFGVRIIHQKLNNFFSGYIPHSEQDDQKEVITTIETNVFYIVAEKYPLQCAVCLFIISFLLIRAYFCGKLVFLGEHVCVYILYFNIR